jgi:outer membrane lipoprotein SlyB
VVGAFVGNFVGSLVGAFVGNFVGSLVGNPVGFAVGNFVGASVGVAATSEQIESMMSSTTVDEVSVLKFAIG